MKKTLIFFVVPLLLSSCAYTVTRSYHVRPEKQVSYDYKPRVVKNKNLSGLNATYLGTIKLDDSGFTINCSEFSAIEKLTGEAYLLGANLINITQEAKPGFNSNCYRCIADFYSIPMDNTVRLILDRPDREIIRYSERDAITWFDIEDTLSETSPLPFVLDWDIVLTSGGADAWTGNYRDFTAEAVFYRDLARVKPSYMTAAGLDHINGLYLLTQIYAGRLANQLNSSAQKGKRDLKVKEILNSYYSRLKSEQELYMLETQYGKNREAQVSWNRKIWDEIEQMKWAEQK
ncbi:MAG: hypothetical protein ACOYXB_07320 [Bacteroidota bacterium]